jgi:membrane protease YdiL (CAAX protease family)
MVGWVLFSWAAFGDRTDWPAWARDLPQLNVSYQLAFAVAVAVLLIFVRVVKRAPLATLGLNIGELGQDARWLARALPLLALGYVLLAGLGVLGVYVFAADPADTIRRTVQGSFYQPSLPRAFEVLIAAPVLEEIWFRGMLYTPLRRERGRTVAILFTAVIFAFVHGPVPVTQFIGGLIFAWAYESRRTLVAPMVLHFCGNGTLVLGGMIQNHWNLLG